MDRRSFLQVGVATGGLAGCNAGVHGSHAPGVSKDDVDAIVGRLDRALARIDATDPFAKFGKSVNPATREVDTAYVKATLRAITVVGVMRETPIEAQVHPEMQKRLWGSVLDMDIAVAHARDRLAKLTPEEQRRIREVLIDKKRDVADTILHDLDVYANEAGISLARRLQLRNLGDYAVSRLRQSPGLFAQELVRKVDDASAKISEDPDGWMRTTMGADRYLAFREQTAFAHARWMSVDGHAMTDVGSKSISSENLTSLRDGEPGTTEAVATASAAKPRKGKTTMTVGGILLGAGAAFAATGALIMAAGEFGGVFLVTVGALAAIAGLITLLVGAILYASS